MLSQLRDLIQQDVGNRGLATDPLNNLFTARPNDFANACHSIASTPNASIAIFTGFFIPGGDPPAAETDGPLGAVYLGRALTPLGIKVAIVVEDYCRQAMEAGADAAGISEAAPLLSPSECESSRFTHFIAIECVGPSHHSESIREQFHGDATILQAFEREVPERERNRCHNARGDDVTQWAGSAPRIFEEAGAVVTIGIGDGGNEIGMGKIPWNVIAKNVPRGAALACRVPTDHLIVAGVSNWGAYALANGVRLLRNAPLDRSLFDVDRERAILDRMIHAGPLVDGITKHQSLSVDGLPIEEHCRLLEQMEAIARDFVA